MIHGSRIPIGDYGLIGDTRSAALVSPHGAIDWCCLPRFDSPPVFGQLVGGPEAGAFIVGPGEGARLRDRSYVDGSATLQTTWEVDGGELVLRDSMVAEVVGRTLPATLLVRRLSASGRSIRARLHFRPRFGYGRSRARRIRTTAGSLVVEQHGLALALTSDAAGDLHVDSDVVFEVEPDGPVTVAMTAAYRSPLVFVSPQSAADEAREDERRWQEWSARIPADPSHREVIVRSLLTLKLLTYSPSGAPVAAPTTSLPEALGGSRNWDYRYAWPRDASIGVDAFLAANKPDEARALLVWLLHASRLERPRLPALFTLDGRPGPNERVLEEWPGYGDSRPVRIGNGAARQHQLDNYGWVLEAARALADSGHRLDGETWRTMAGFADRVVTIWGVPDAGIWERRDEPRHHLHSKLMAHRALDAAAHIARLRGGSSLRKAGEWRAARDRVAGDVRKNGFNDDLGSYTAAYGHEDLDASVLLLATTDIEPVDSERLSATIDSIRSVLGAEDPLLFRYLDDDGLPGGEGAFLPCSFWLVQALVRVRRVDEAYHLFEELVAIGGPLGLFPEEVDPVTREHLGNFPQALTHSTLLQAAAALGLYGSP